jgi:hypothetical protein
VVWNRACLDVEGGEAPAGELSCFLGLESRFSDCTEQAARLWHLAVLHIDNL